jgi:hypothetical protein
VLHTAKGGGWGFLRRFCEDILPDRQCGAKKGGVYDLGKLRSVKRSNFDLYVFRIKAAFFVSSNSVHSEYDSRYDSNWVHFLTSLNSN